MEPNIKLKSGTFTSNADLPNAAKISRDKEQQTAKINKQKENSSILKSFNLKQNARAVSRQQNDEKIRLQEEGFAEDREKQRIKNNSMRQAFNSKGEPILNFWNKYDENNQDNKPKSKSDIFMENYLKQPTARNLYYNNKGSKVFF